jgi:hypothetical protein
MFHRNVTSAPAPTPIAIRISYPAPRAPSPREKRARRDVARQVDPLHAQRQLILLSVGTAERRRAMATQAARLAREIDWATLHQTLAIRRLLPTLGPRVVELAGEHASGVFAAAVDDALHAGRRQGALLALLSERLSAALARAGIACTPLKGPTLAEALYGDPGRRPSSDIDLLVPRERLHDAVEIVRAQGYAPPTDHLDGEGLPLLHFALLHERGELPPVELHWRVHWYERRFASERLLPPDGVPRAGWRPAPAHSLAALLLFYARDGFVDVRLASDLGAWWDAFGPTLPTGALEPVLDAHPALARALIAAAHVAERIVGLPTHHLISPARKLGWRARTAVRLANPNPHGTSPAQLYADIGLVDGLLSPKGGTAAFARRQLLPPRAVLRQRTPQGHGASPLAHGMRELGRYGLAFARLMSAPETPRTA